MLFNLNPIELLFGLAAFFASKYFFIFLIVGGVIFVDARPRGNAGDGERSRARTIAIVIMIIGVLGAIQGVPYWYQSFHKKTVSNEYFEGASMTKALVELARYPIYPVAGVIRINPYEARKNPLSRYDDHRRFVDPGDGMYQALEYDNCGRKGCRIVV